MKALVYTEPHKLEFRDIEKPRPKQGYALIKVAYGGICGSDMHIFHGTHPRAKAPLVCGHEFSGVIEEINGESELKAGDKVVTYPLVYCGKCSACKTGNYHVCETLRLIGIDSDGGFAEYASVPIDKLYKLPDDMDLMKAAVIEPLAVTVHAFRESKFKIGDTVVITGMGPIGTLVAETARVAGASKIITFDINEDKVKKSAEMGFISFNSKSCDMVEEVKKLTNGAGCDVLFECSNAPVIAELSSKLVRVQGQIVAVAIYNEPPKVNLRDVNFKEIDIIGVRVYRFKDYDIAIDLIANSKIDVSNVISHVIPLEQGATGFGHMDSGEGVKVLLKMNEG